MRRTVIRYKVKPDQAEKNEALVRAVFEELQQTKPDGLRYVTFKLDDGVTFIHLISNETDEERSAVVKLKAFQRFTENIDDRYDEPAVTTELHVVGSYRLFEQ